MKRWIFPVVVGLAVAALSYQATLVATPYALMHKAMDRIGQGGHVNQFTFGKPSTSYYQPIVRPSPDLSYSTCVFDISKGPVLVDVEPVPRHYWAVGIYDARTDVAAVRGDRETGGKPARLALLRRGEKAPAGYEPVELDHDKGVVLIRILFDGKEDYAVIDAIRRKSTCKPAA